MVYANHNAHGNAARGQGEPLPFASSTSVSWKNAGRWTDGPWDRYIRQVLSYPAHHEIRVPTDRVPPPLQAGFKFSFGMGKNQLADRRLKLADGSSIHVRVYDNCYTIHWDHVDPSVDLIEHLRQDAPELFRRLREAAPAVGFGLLLLALASDA